jgi:hypothetical protein
MFNQGAHASDEHTGGNACNVTALTPAASQTERLPWSAPVGHRQPRAADVPSEPLSKVELEQRRLDKELDRKLIICRGC